MDKQDIKLYFPNIFVARINEGKKGVSYQFGRKFKDPLTGRYKTAVATVYGVTKTDQAKALGEIEEKIKEALDPLNYYKGVTFEAVANEWAKDSEATVKPSTNLNRKDDIKRLIKYLPKGILLHQITADILHEVNIKLIEKPYKNNTIRPTLQRVKAIYTYAKRKKYIRDIDDILEYQIQKAKLSASDVQATKDLYLEHEELTEVLQQLLLLPKAEPNKRYSMICEFMALSGLRIGEALALKESNYNHVTLNGERISQIFIEETLDSKTRKTDTPKTQSSIRSVDISPRCVEILDLLIKENHALKSIHGENFNKNNFIFTNSKGNLMENQDINKKIKKTPFYKKKKVTCHTFRHTHITLLAEMKVPLIAVLERVGHKDSRVTTKIYMHVTNKMRGEARKALEDYRPLGNVNKNNAKNVNMV
ncbi:site-specific integrase [Veillonella sp. R32]|uniref:tyrosine-type recombinase/integrase n=1 Tax=Veillonella sp. R32 TaxID=2021312 RepID=UPI00138A23D1|nr:site-specific integrase [Veillonella sp. R32]KAF1682588.1 hypothetical protein VER_05120 [Veillonella sp. R32]